MATLKERVLDLIRTSPGLSDREIADRLLGSAAPQQGVNQIARTLAGQRLVARRARRDGKLGNYPDEPLSEDDVKRNLLVWLESIGWKVTVIWGRGQGIDVEALQPGGRWIIEAKGRGSLNAMRVNYFLGVLGELLQRMSDPQAKYSIALPDLPQFRRLWERLPELAKQRTGISALFVSDAGRVEEVVSR
jgi:hypothetical protein